MYDEKSAQKLVIQYGGSVKPENAASMLSPHGVDGALIGGASLDADQFLAIAQGWDPGSSDICGVTKTRRHSHYESHSRRAKSCRIGAEPKPKSSESKEPDTKPDTKPDTARSNAKNDARRMTRSLIRKTI
jgi:hypothetical protein